VALVADVRSRQQVRENDDYLYALCEIRMPNQEHAELIPLVTGVIDDIHTLVSQEILLARSELKKEVLNFKKSIILIAISLVCATLGILMAGFALTYLIAYFVPEIDLWVLYSLVAIVSLLLSRVFILKGLSVSRVIYSINSNDQVK
jgi:hypothetical protein